MMADEAKCGWHGRGLAILRMMVGVVFAAHGYQKLMVYHFAGVAGMFKGIGIPVPEVSAVVVTLVELVGGVLLFFGLLTRGAALLLAINMMVAVLAVHLKGGFFAPGGVEYPLTLLVANVAFVLGGPGICALDNLMGKKKIAAPQTA